LLREFGLTLEEFAAMHPSERAFYEGGWQRLKEERDDGGSSADLG